MADELKQLRSRIDALDQEILKLVSERAAAAHAIGKLKGDGPVYRPEREAQVLAALAKWGPAAPRRFNGMWALLLYDTKEKALLVWSLRMALPWSSLAVRCLWYFRQTDWRICLAASRHQRITNS